MTILIVTTKLYMPPPRLKIVSRPRLIEQLNEGLTRKLTVISAPAGSGKTTLVSEWLAGGDRPFAWISMDDGDNDPACFLTYLYTALRNIDPNIDPNIESGIVPLLHSPQPLPIELMMTTLLHEIITIPNPFVLVFDDYHVLKTGPLHDAISLLLERMPPQMHLVIATREEPRLPIARLRVRNQLNEVRASDLRFTYSEATEFLGKVMGIELSSENIALLEARTEGWIAGLQLAALSMKEQIDVATFLQSFSGSHHFILDYLIEEVLTQQSASIQAFLLHTSILDRLSGPLCDAVFGQSDICSGSGQETLEFLERANLFIVPLDSERRWYRYHHLFADLLRQRLRQHFSSTTGEGERIVAELHTRASIWYEDNGLEMEAFHHAVAANNTSRAARLVEGERMPLLFRGGVVPVLDWLESLPHEEMDARPAMWVMYASALLMTGQMTGVEPKLLAAEKAMQGLEPDAKSRDTLGHIAAIRATLAVSKHQLDDIMVEAKRALDYLNPDNLPVRTATTWSLGYAYHLQGNRSAASKAYHEALSNSEKIGHFVITMMATLGLAKLQEADNQLHMAAETYQHVRKLAGSPPLPAACEAHLGLARIFYEWNDLHTAEHHGQQSIQLARQLEQTDRIVATQVFLARLKLAQGDVSGAAAMIANAEYVARKHCFVMQMPPIAEAQVLILLQQDNLPAAARLAQKHDLPILQARVLLTQGETFAALAVLEPLLEQAEAKQLEDERLKTMLLLAVVLHAHGEQAKAAQMVKDALVMAEPGGFIRTFVDEGIPMKRLLCDGVVHGTMPSYIEKLLAEWTEDHADSLIEPLSERELEILQLIEKGLSNRDIAQQLFLALSTVKGHNRNIFDKLQVQRRTEAVARARQLGLL
ncbi:LuxR C-terminal-related transcriptional regulator [Brevibacillus sp. BC25]|uniref:LuxR C-terminal-related transcriptional regulator n=1 Tax=Brevibacillus sp. BC25 TaxID=1144308 RepID=UPI0002712947|nr:LuxR C-terminal-related transcriptional regulator [Brevibacillus sp. BC25]EJL26168.1 ATP-dependent transcriptional regulator [Brevibacillus sp. BC25]